MAGSMSVATLDFEKPALEIEAKIAELKSLSAAEQSLGKDLNADLTALEAKAVKLLDQAYARLDAWQKTQVARHPDRPHTKDYVAGMVTDFTPLTGDRLYAEDAAMVSGLGRIDGRAVAILGQEKGADMDTRLKHNFGMARPEGYRKAQRLMRLAERFGLPIVTFVDTPGAYPGVGAEERGQAEAIAKSIETCLDVRVPLISLVIGEGGSGGAIAIAAANRVYMLEHAIYSVISPEGCASILWRDGAFAKDAAGTLRLTAQDLQAFKVIDGIVEEPRGGAHRHSQTVIATAKAQILQALKAFEGQEPEQIRQQRRAKFLAMGRNL